MGNPKSIQNEAGWLGKRWESNSFGPPPVQRSLYLPSGKLTCFYEKSPCSVENSTIMFLWPFSHSYVQLLEGTLPVIKHGNGKWTIYRWFSHWNLHLHGIYMDLSLPCLITQRFSHVLWFYGASSPPKWRHVHHLKRRWNALTGRWQRHLRHGHWNHQFLGPVEPGRTWTVPKTSLPATTGNGKHTTLYIYIYLWWLGVGANDILLLHDVPVVNCGNFHGRGALVLHRFFH